MIQVRLKKLGDFKIEKDLGFGNFILKMEN